VGGGGRKSGYKFMFNPFKIICTECPREFRIEEYILKQMIQWIFPSFFNFDSFKKFQAM
jgi:hypothetical protein